MAVWKGFPLGNPTPTYNLRQWADTTSLNDVVWWESTNPGVTFQPTPCGGLSCAPFEKCGDSPCVTECQVCEEPTVDDPCCHTFGEPVHFDPFWIKSCLKCSLIGTPPQDLYDMTVKLLERDAWPQIARALHLQLQNYATDLTGPSASTLSEAIGTLIKARTVQGAWPGYLVAPFYAVPALTQAGLITSTQAGLPYGPGGIPIIIDPGFPTTGPGGTPPAAGSAYIYIIDQPPAVSLRSDVYPGGNSWNANNVSDLSMFNPRCGCDFTPHAKSLALAAFNPCHAYAIQVDVTNCCCGGPTEDAGTEEGGGK